MLPALVNMGRPEALHAGFAACNLEPMVRENPSEAALSPSPQHAANERFVTIYDH